MSTVNLRVSENTKEHNVSYIYFKCLQFTGRGSYTLIIHILCPDSEEKQVIN